MSDNNKNLYERVGAQIGWNFQKITQRERIIGKKWDYLKVVRKYLNSKITLLDIGTGGGELLLQIAPLVKQAFGIDYARTMIRTANQNLKKTNYQMLNSS